MTDAAVLLPLVPRSPEQASAEAPVVGDRLLRRIDRLLGYTDRWSAALLPRALDPLQQLGALANYLLLLATASGVLLLFWYVPSVHQAHTSMLAMEQAPWTAGLLRSLHRYASDAAMLLVLLHGLKLFLARRFSGPRWLAWVTGLACLFVVWLVGWLGYWLVWDVRAQQIAVGTARLLDALPLFVDPLEREFLTDASINSLLFFLVYFAHMLLPLAMAVGLWLHISRLARGRWLPDRRLAIAAAAALLLVSLGWPATTAAAASMARPPLGFTMDAWYLAPLWLSDRLHGGWLWLLLLVGGTLALTVPFWLVRRRLRPAQVDTARCNACRRCSMDCPYRAITMVPRTDGKDLPVQAQVDPALCVGCGICAGSCDSTGIGLDWLPVRSERARIEAAVAAAAGRADRRGLLFACAHGGIADLQLDPDGSCRTLPGWLCVPVPCAGWVHMLLAERPLHAGAREVVIASCGDGNCRYREGDLAAAQRATGQREPKLRADHVDPARVRVLALAPGDDIAAVLAGSAPRRRRWPGVVVLLALLLVLVGGTVVPYRTPHSAMPELVVSFKHPGQLVEQRRELSAEEQARLPSHMRRTHEIVRTRQPVRLRVVVDGQQLLQRTVRPGGLWQDGNSIAIEHLPIAAGTHRVEVAIGDDADPLSFPFHADQQIDFVDGTRRVVLFDRHTGFTWH